MLFAPVPTLVLGLAAVASALSGVAAKIDGHSGPRAPSRVLRALNPQEIAALNSNGKRLAAGLPPLPVRRKWTRTDTAKRAGTSPQASTESVQATRSDDTSTPVGYLSTSSDSDGYALDGTSTSATANRFRYTAASSGVTNQITIIDSSNSGTSTPAVGAIVTPGTILSNDSPNVAWIVSTAAYGAPTTPQSTADGDVESAIWNVDADTGALTVSWVNYGSSTDEPFVGQLYFFPSDGTNPDRLGISSPACISAYTPTPYAVSLTLQPST